MAWRPTKPEEKILARKLDGQTCEFKDLRPGDVFHAIAADGHAIHPHTEEPDDEAVARVTGYPIQNVDNCNGSLLGAVGWGVPIEVYPSMDELKRKGLS